MTLYEQWSAALADVEIQHMDPACAVRIEIVDDKPPTLILSIANPVNNDTDVRMERLVVSCVSLAWFPGIRAARAWIAAAWAGYLAHEGLELVTVKGARVLDPHAEPYPSNPYNRGVRESLPEVLTPETLRRALCVIMSAADADALIS